MDLNATVDVNCGWKDGHKDGRTENRTPISHLAKTGSTKMVSAYFHVSVSISLSIRLS